MHKSISPKSGRAPDAAPRWIQVQAGAIRPEDLLRRSRRVALAKRLSVLYRSRALFSVRMRHWIASCERNAGFQCPPQYAQACFGRRLLLQVSPGSIGAELPDWLTDGQTRLHTSDYFFCGAPIAELTRPLGNTAVFKEIEELFAARFDFRATPTYGRMLKQIEPGNPPSRRRTKLASRAELDRYFENVLRLVESIRANGVVGHSESAGLFVPDREIGVAIAGNGALVKLPGAQHRCAIASMLGCTRIPVEIRMVHTSRVRAQLESGRRSLLEALEGVFDEAAARYTVR